MADQINVDQLQQELKDSQTKDSSQTTTQDDNLIGGTFKGTKELMQGYKDIQGAFTKLTQDTKQKDDTISQLQQQIQDLKREKELNTPSPFFMQQDQNQTTTQPSDTFYSGDESAVRQTSAQTYQTMRIAEVLEEEHLKDQPNFMGRYGAVQVLAQQYPHLKSTGAGVRKLFQLADEQIEKDRKNAAYKGLETLLGRQPTDEDLSKFRQSFGEPQTDQTQTTQMTQTTQTKDNAYMPDTTFSSRTGVEQTKIDYDAEIEKATAEGDYEKVTQLTFQKAIME